MTSDPGFGMGKPEDDARPEVMSGLYRNAAIEIEPDAFSLVSTAEELSVAVAEMRDIYKLKTVNPDEAISLDEATLMALSDDDIASYLSTAKQDDGGAARQALLRGLLANPRRNLREWLEQAFQGDPTGQYLLLQDTMRQLNEQADGRPDATRSALLERLGDAAADIALQHGPRVRADLNTVDVAALSGGTAADIKRFQAGYHDVVVGKGTLAATLQAVLGDFAGDDPAAALTRLVQALGRDLSATRPSVDSTHLFSLLQDQFLAATAVSVLERCRKLPGHANAATMAAARQ